MKDHKLAIVIAYFFITLVFIVVLGIIVRSVDMARAQELKDARFWTDFRVEVPTKVESVCYETRYYDSKDRLIVVEQDEFNRECIKNSVQ